MVFGPGELITMVNLFLEEQMTRLEIFILSELLYKASMSFSENESGIPMDWFDKVVNGCSELTHEEKTCLLFKDGSYFKGDKK